MLSDQRASTASNLLPKLMSPKRSFLSQALLTRESLKSLEPQTLGKTAFDFATFLAGAQGADIGAQCSIW
jgi:hypothetical protein